MPLTWAGPYKLLVEECNVLKLVEWTLVKGKSMQVMVGIAELEVPGVEPQIRRSR